MDAKPDDIQDLSFCGMLVLTIPLPTSLAHKHLQAFAIAPDITTFNGW